METKPQITELLAQAFQKGLQKSTAQSKSNSDRQHALKIITKVAERLELSTHRLKSIFAFEADPQEMLRSEYMGTAIEGIAIVHEVLKLQDFFVKDKLQKSKVFEEFKRLFKKGVSPIHVVFNVKGNKEWVLTSMDTAHRQGGMARIILPTSTTVQDLQIIPLQLFLDEL